VRSRLHDVVMRALVVLAPLNFVAGLLGAALRAWRDGLKPGELAFLVVMTGAAAAAAWWVTMGAWNRLSRRAADIRRSHEELAPVDRPRTR
jgi:hypothetical protein